MSNVRQSAHERFSCELQVPPELYARVRSAVKATPAARIRTRTRLIIALCVLASCVTAVLMIASQVVYGRQAPGFDTSTHSAAAMLGVFFLLATLAGVVTFIALRRSSQSLEAVALWLAAGLTAPLYAALTLLAPLHAHDPPPAAIQISAWGARCMLLSALIGGLALAGFTWALRRAAPSASTIRGAALGAAAGAWAGVSLFIFCPVGDVQHLTLGHVAPVLALTLVGVGAAARLLRP